MYPPLQYCAESLWCPEKFSVFHLFILPSLVAFLLPGVSFDAQNILLFMKSNLSIFLLLLLPLVSFPNPVSQSFCPVVSSKSFIILGLPFRSLIHFEVDFLCGVLLI